MLLFKIFSIESLLENPDKVITGTDAFKLYDTYGFPIELTEEIASESNKTVDMVGFKEELQKRLDELNK